MTRYRTIVADPPWKYEPMPTMLGKGTRAERKTGYGEVRRITKALPYPTLTIPEIVALPVGEMIDRDGALFLWTTNRYLHDAFHVLEAWGFQFTQTLVWVKDRRTPFIASVAPNHAEFLLVGRRGSPRWQGSLPSNVVEIAYSPRDRRAAHSAKPEAFIDFIEQVSPGPYLEMFARRARFGWDYWGDESLGTAELPGEAA